MPTLFRDSQWMVESMQHAVGKARGDVLMVAAMAKIAQLLARDRMGSHAARARQCNNLTETFRAFHHPNGIGHTPGAQCFPHRMPNSNST